MRRVMAKIADFFRESDKILLLICFFATTFGCMAVFSSTYYKETYRPVMVQSLCMVLGIAAAIVISTLDYEKILSRWHLVGLLGLVPTILTFFIGVAPEGTDDKAWLDLGFTTFQPSELLKICFIITFSVHMRRIKPNINKLKYLIPLAAHGALPVVMILVQGDYGTALVFAVMVLFMMWAGGVSWKYFLLAFSGVAAVSPIAYFFLLNEEHRKRIMTMFSAEKDIQGIDFQQWRGCVALANGGFAGQGFLQGDLTQAGAVPEGHNDFIFVSIGEEFGLLGCLAVILLIGAICIRCIRVAKICTNDAGKYMCVGVFAMIFAQAVINLGMCTSVLPVIGVTLPFFSAGGTSLFCLFLGIGLVLNVYMHRNSRTIYLHD
ncbi:MAG: rod shape-determining protein RodA [Clostridia bacterium]|nr:rod shape-determining protein RodA [Clostridia bacterium]